MTNTKRYIYGIKFDPGSAEIDEQSLSQAIYRAQSITGHLIRIESREDIADPDDVGYALKRAEGLRNLLVERSVDPGRIELVMATKYRTRALIILYPRVPSLSDDGGILTFDEVRALQTARELMLFPPKEKEYLDVKRKSNEHLSQDDWKRIVGYGSLAKWKRSGAKHPLYELECPSSTRKRGTQPWWKFW